MSIKLVKNTLVFSVVIAVVFGFFLSCENPFSNNLGAKVDVAPPTITVLTPTVGSLIKGEVQFAGSATAYRELRSIEVKIYASDSAKPPVLDWTSVNVKLIGENIKEKNWTFNLDTANYYGAGKGLEDGFLKIQFRARDPSLFTDTVELIYIVKNKPSVIKLTSPDSARLNPNNPDMAPPVVQTGMEISGTITDRRGIKPGFPKIKIWPEDLPGGEPSADDPAWGWMQLFLSGTDNLDTWTYTDRTKMQVVRAASFSFLLCQFEIGQNGRVVYTLNASGSYQPLPVGRYNFRIYTSETYFDERADILVTNPDTGVSRMEPNPQFWFPRDPRPQDGEAEITGYYPEIDPAVYPDPQNRGLAYSVKLESASVPPDIRIDNGDVSPLELEKVPNHYIIDSTERKILTGGSDVRPYFRLRILAAHEQVIDRAVLEWEHRATGRKGLFLWDNDGPGSLGYAVDDTGHFTSAYGVSDYNRGAYGHLGTYADAGNPSMGKRFVFTAKSNTAYLDPNTESVSGNNVFEASSDPYMLKVKVWTTGDITAEQNFTVYMDDRNPVVKIHSVWGAETTPAAFSNPNDFFNTNPYVVNGNIQVAVEEPIAHMGILSRPDANNGRWIRWLVESDSTNHTTTNTDTVLAKLNAYINNPSAENMAAIEAQSGIIDRGWVNPPLNSGLPPDLRNHFKVNTVKWNKDNEAVWLYVIAQDRMHNLGFVMQKLQINQDGDLPQIKGPDAFKDSTEVGGDAFSVLPGSTVTQNVLDPYQGIDLTITDDDGIRRTANDIVITLRDIENNRQVTLTTDQLGFLNGKETAGLENNRLELLGQLSPAAMAQALYGTGTGLADGRYRLTITVRDNIDAKVKITPQTVPSDTPAAVTAEKIYYFAVQSKFPVITVTFPDSGFVTKDDPKHVTGTVISGFPLTTLDVTFVPPDVVNTNSGTAGLYTFINQEGTINNVTPARVNNEYVYTWTVPNVDFNQGNVGQTTFTVKVYDCMGSLVTEKGDVDVDNKPPEIAETEFNFGRQGAVNGKVPIYIQATDESGLKETGEYVHVQWWLRPRTQATPNQTQIETARPEWNETWNGSNTDSAFSGGLTGRFKISDDQGSGTYLLVVDTRGLSGAYYDLFVIAQDKADNLSLSEAGAAGPLYLRTFEINQAGDMPNLEDYSPNGGVRDSMGLSIMGRVSDDDGFNALSPKLAYPADVANPETERGYVQIRFDKAESGAPVWTKWYNALGSVDPSGDITFNLRLEEAAVTGSDEFDGYFTYAGVKKYQIRVIDEPDSGAGNPGKNPEVQAGVTSIPAYTPALIGAAERIFPAAGTYSFTLKNDAPRIWFRYNDPDSGHNGFYNNDTNTPNAAENYTGYRPSFNNLNTVGAVQGLTQALAGIYIEEILDQLQQVVVIFTTRTGSTVTRHVHPNRDAPLAGFTSTGSRHFFDVPNTWMNGGTGNFNFGAQAEGPLTITVEAIDSLGKITRVDWDYYKDTTGPELSWLTNLAEPVKGRDGAAYIRGNFTDNYSPIRDTFEWRIEAVSGTPTWSSPAGGEPVAAKIGNNKAEWSIPIPTNCPEGDYRLYITGYDRINNTRGEQGPFPFTLDQNPPDVSQGQHMVVIGNNLQTASGSFSQKVLTEAERVFSAASVKSPTPDASNNTDKVFTLSGMVYEYTLTSLKAVYSNTGDAIRIADLTHIDDWDGTTWTFEAKYSGEASPHNHVVSIDGRNYLENEAGNYRIRKATATDYTVGLYHRLPDDGKTPNDAYLYVWELDVSLGDFYQLMHKASSNDDTPAEGDAASGVRRQITVTALDKAGYTSSRRNWYFSLDNQQPVIKLVLNTPDSSATPPVLPSVLSASTISISLEASDDTSIRQIMYLVAKYDYVSKTWRYGSGWNTELPDPDDDANITAIAPSAWHELYRSGDGTTESIVNQKYLYLNDTHLAASGVVFDSNNRAQEGQYRILYSITDWSLSSTDAGNPRAASGPVFFIDRNDPEIEWFGDSSYSANVPFKNYYNNGNLTFYFTVKDANTIAGVTEASLGSQTPDILWLQSGGAYSAALPDTNNGTAALRGMVTFTGTGLSPGRNTVSLTLKDGAGNSASVNASKDFYLDNIPPGISLVTPLVVAGKTEAITGRVEFNGTFTKAIGSSPVSLSAFYVVNVDTPVSLAAMRGTINALDDAALKDHLENPINGWYYDSGRPILWDNSNSKELLSIESNQVNAKLVIGHTRDFKNSSYITEATAASILWNGDTISAEVSTFTIFMLAVDEAGNRTVEEFIFTIYPAGDFPVVTTIANPKMGVAAEAQIMNGKIRISGTAEDNVRVKNVWFRVTDAGSTTPESLYVPNWNTTTWAASGGNQKARLTPGGAELAEGVGGWYMANGGGNKSVSWWAYINENGEIDPTEGSSRAITVEVVAEDTYQVAQNGDLVWDNGLGELSAPESASALIVTGAPRFDDQQIRLADDNANLTTVLAGITGTNGNVNLTDGWGSIANTNIRKKALYSITVKNEVGIESIRWVTANSGTIPLMGTTVIGDRDNEGLVLTAKPKELLKGNLSALDNGRQYMIWEPEDRRYEKVSGSYDTGGGSVLAQTAEGYFEWVVIVQVNADTLGYTNTAGYKKIILRANDISKVVSLSSEQEIELPIDNLPPVGMYTYTTNIAGSAQQFGGEAGDQSMVNNVPVPNGLKQVVVWFSRKINFTDAAETFVPWNEKVSGSAFVEDVNSSQLNGNGGPLPDGIQMPVISGSGEKTGNNSCIVIDRNDPWGSQEHHGHQRPMGFAAVGGAMGTSWYVTLDSTKMFSGSTTIHFLIYDQAGNTTYYSQKLMILNGLPKITHIQLATDIRGDMGLQTDLGAGTGNFGMQTGIMQQIRSAFGLGNGRDNEMGISSLIPIDTNNGGVYGVAFDNAFNVRNGLLAMKVDITEKIDTNDDRTFRVEYVSGAREISGRNNLVGANGIKAGRVYIINNPGSTNPGAGEMQFPWGSFGAKGSAYRKGLVFLAIENGTAMTDAIPAAGNYGTPSVWELNSNYYNAGGDRANIPANLALNDVVYPAGGSGDDYGKSAEFVYRANAFDSVPFNGAVGTAVGSAPGNYYTRIHDFYQDNLQGDNRTNDGRPMAYPAPSVFAATGAQYPWAAHSLFIVRVFDRTDPDLLGDFALLSIRVNNNDITPPYAQLYDLNPKTEGTGSQVNQADALNAGTNIGQNRTRGGLAYVAGRDNNEIVKTGHIEPRTTTSLGNIDMGGEAMPSINRPAATPSAYFTRDTVSGDVIVRGYAEDDQRIGRIELLFSGQTAPVTILQARTPNAANRAMLESVQGDRVRFTETVALDRHRVEWAYLWPTESIPANTIVGNVTVTARAYTYNAAAAENKPSRDISFADTSSNTFDYFNPNYPISTANNNFRRYNSLTVNLRPYITGIIRNQVSLSHDTRSRQGRYMLYRGEAAVVRGFNLGGGNTASTTVTLPGMGDFTTVNVGTIGSYGIPAANNARYRQFTVNATSAVTGNGVVRLRVRANNTDYEAVNTGDGRLITGSVTNNNAVVRPTVIQPWNIEYTGEGTELWDDFTMVHIWQSNGNTNNTDNGVFRKGTNMIVEYPAMTIDPRNGNLYESHYEGGGNGNNTATIAVSGNSNANIANNPGAPGVNIGINGSATAKVNIVAFCDPIYEPDIFISDAGTLWSAYNVTGRQGGSNTWGAMGGIYVAGPGGGNPGLTSGLGQNNQYHAESTFFRDRTDQFSNPHLAVHVPSGTNEYIHVSYYDAVSHAIKYRFILRGSPGTVNSGSKTNGANNAVWMWTNLDGGSDGFDTGASTFIDNTIRGLAGVANNATIAASARMVTGHTRSANAGLHNSIALTRQGYPVIAYYDEANQRLKLAVSNRVAPVLGANWKIIDGIFDSSIAATGYADTNDLYRENTGQFVSLKIDTRNQNAQVFHIAAMNSADKNLVYITGNLNVNDTLASYNISNVKVQIVDSVGSVGRWCQLSLDAAGNPWIAYHDESYKGARDGVKAAYLDTARFIKGSTGNFTDEDIDLNGTPITGWEAMHVPTQFLVNDARLGMERFPTIRNTGATKANGLTRFAAVGYLGEDQYRVAYYVE